MTQNRFYSSTTKATTTTVDPGAAGTTLTVVDSTVFASLDGQFPWTGAISWGLVDQELVNVTARPSNTTLTIVRGQDGTAGVAHPVGATVTHDVSARDFNEAGAHIGATSGVHGVTGLVVGTTDSQTLTNKTLTTPTIASFANAAHNHSDAASGGLIGSAAAIVSTGGSLTCTTSYQNIPNLTGNLVAGNTYRFRVCYKWQASATTTTFQPGMGGTVTPSSLFFRSMIQVNSTGGSSTQVNTLLNNPTSGPSAAAAQATTDFGVVIDGIIVVSGSGTLTASARHVAATATVQSGGLFILEQIA